MSICPLPWQTFTISPSGDVAPCVFWRLAADRKFEPGFVNDRRFEEIWNSLEWQNIRASQPGDREGLACRNCALPALFAARDTAAGPACGRRGGGSEPGTGFRNNLALNDLEYRRGLRRLRSRPVLVVMMASRSVFVDGAVVLEALDTLTGSGQARARTGNPAPPFLPTTGVHAWEYGLSTIEREFRRFLDALPDTDDAETSLLLLTEGALLADDLLSRMLRKFHRVEIRLFTGAVEPATLTRSHPRLSVHVAIPPTRTSLPSLAETMRAVIGVGVDSVRLLPEEAAPLTQRLIPAAVTPAVAAALSARLAEAEAVVARPGPEDRMRPGGGIGRAIAASSQALRSELRRRFDRPCRGADVTVPGVTVVVAPVDPSWLGRRVRLDDWREIEPGVFSGGAVMAVPGVNLANLRFRVAENGVDLASALSPSECLTHCGRYRCFGVPSRDGAEGRYVGVVVITTDGSDPRANGRTYTLRLHRPALNHLRLRRPPILALSSNADAGLAPLATVELDGCGDVRFDLPEDVRLDAVRGDFFASDEDYALKSGEPAHIVRMADGGLRIEVGWLPLTLPCAEWEPEPSGARLRE